MHSSPSYHETHPNTVIKPLRALPQQREMFRVKYCHPWCPYRTILPSKMQCAGALNHRSKGVYLSSLETVLKAMSIIWLEFNRGTINTRHLIGKLMVVDQRSCAN